MELWGPAHCSPREECPSTLPSRGSAGPLLPHIVPRAGRHQTRNLSVWCWQHCLHGVYICMSSSGGQASLTCTDHVCCLLLELHVFVLCPFLKHWLSRFGGPQGCQTFLWPWDVRNAVPVCGLSSQLSTCFLFLFGHGNSQAFPFCLLALGPYSEQGSLPWDRTHIYKRDFNLYLSSLIHLAFPFHITKMLFQVQKENKTMKYTRNDKYMYI